MVFHNKISVQLFIYIYFPAASFVLPVFCRSVSSSSWSRCSLSASVVSQTTAALTETTFTCTQDSSFCSHSEKDSIPTKLFTWRRKMNIPLISLLTSSRAYSDYRRFFRIFFKVFQCLQTCLTEQTQPPSFILLIAFLKMSALRYLCASKKL